MYEKVLKKHKLYSRIVVTLGILPGVWFLIVTETEIGLQITIRCGYWFVMLALMTIIMLSYGVLITKIIKDLRLMAEHAHSLNERRHYHILYLSTIFEALIASVIFLVSTVGFLLVDLRCFLSHYVNLPAPIQI